MKCKRVPLIADVQKYEIGKNMEDGFELWSNVVTKNGVNLDSIIKVTKENGQIVCPYIHHRRGNTFIEENDYIVVEEDGTKNVCGGEKVFKRYEVIE